MGKKNKLQKFKEIKENPYVFENRAPKNPVLTNWEGQQVDFKGKWKSDFFGNNHDIYLELACGKGEYTLGLSQMQKDINVIGVDIKGARIWKGAKQAEIQNYENIAFIRTRIEQLSDFFDVDEISEIWIIFPDPFLRKSRSKKRLTSHTFLDRYRSYLKPGALIHLKTDDPTLYEFTLEVLSERSDYYLDYCSSDIYRNEIPHPALAIQTFYEAMHLSDGKTIKYIRFSYRPDLKVKSVSIPEP